MPTLDISSIYLPLFGVMLFILTMKVGSHRMRTNISFGDGDDPQFTKLIRGHGNFIESTPLTLMLIVLVEYNGANSLWVHALFAVFLISRISHYLQVSGFLKSPLFRMLGMLGTFGTILTASGWLLLH